MTEETFATQGSLSDSLAHYDGYNSESFKDNLDLMAEAREQCPVSHSDRNGGFWLVTRYEDARHVLSNPQIFSSCNGLSLPRNPARPPTPPIDQDGVAQRDYRRMLNPHLTPTAVAVYEDEIREIARELLLPHLQAGRMDAASDYANPLPALVLARTLFGLGPEFDNALLEVKGAVDSMGRDASERDTVRRAWQACYEFCAQIIKQRSREPRRDDVISAILETRVNGELIDSEHQSGVLTITMLGGLKTTTGLIGSFLVAAVERPELRQKMRDLAWVQHAFDEFMRMHPPISWAGREATQQTTVCGRTIERGDAVMVHIASANYDDKVFEDPEVFNPERAGLSRQLGFGLGVHRCVGAHLAKLEVTVAVSEFVRAVDDVCWQDGAAPVFGSGQERSATSLPIKFSAAAAPAAVLPEVQ